MRLDAEHVAQQHNGERGGEAVLCVVVLCLILGVAALRRAQGTSATSLACLAAARDVLHWSSQHTSTAVAHGSAQKTSPCASRLASEACAPRPSTRATRAKFSVATSAPTMPGCGTPSKRHVPYMHSGR